MSLKFKEILHLCEKRGFLKLFSINDCNKISLAPVGFLLQENLKTEWLENTLINRDISVFLNVNKNLSDSFNFIKNFCQDRLPFGIINVSTDTENKQILGNGIDFCFQNMDWIKLESFMFVSSHNSIQHFYNWQKQRRMWWRRISASPGRYSFSDIDILPSGEQSVEIISSYSWGNHNLEKVFYNPNCVPWLSKEQLLAKDGRKRVYAHCIQSITHLPQLVFNMLCDAYDEPLFQDIKRPILRFHRKIAPYKISFAISTNSSNSDELNDLSLYLCKKLRANHISVLLLPNISRNSLESQWMQYDQLGIPYCVILNDNTLKNGIAHLRNRDTTLKEQIHVSDLIHYVEQLFKNY